jgi:FtsH-binding integral membrane protein
MHTRASGGVPCAYSGGRLPARRLGMRPAARGALCTPTAAHSARHRADSWRVPAALRALVGTTHAGHGCTSPDGTNFLLPADVDTSSARHLDRAALSAQEVLDTLERGNGSLSCVIVDACNKSTPDFMADLYRTSPSTLPAPGAPGSFAPMTAPAGALVAFSCKPGSTAAEGGAGERNSVFSANLVKHITTPGLDVELMLRRVSQDVYTATDAAQDPHYHANLTASSPLCIADGNASIAARSGVSTEELAAQETLTAARPSAPAMPGMAPARSMPLLFPGISEDENVARWGFVQKVYGIVALQVNLTAFVVHQCMANWYLVGNAMMSMQWGAAIASLGGLFVLHACRKNYPLNVALLCLWTLASSVSTVHLCYYYIVLYDSGLVLHALQYTAAVVSSLTLATFLAVRKGAKFDLMGPFLFSAALGCLGAALFGVRGGWQPAVGALVFSGYLVYDTDKLIRRYPTDEYIAAAVELYLDVMIIFGKILQLLAMSKAKDKLKAAGRVAGVADDD